MISLDQVLLLQQKVESAVAKIQQLEAENDALRSKCSELTNALSSKTEQLSTIEVDQTQIENGIKKALDRLNSIENSVLKTVGQAASTSNQTTNPNVQIVQTAVVEKSNPVQQPVTTSSPVQQNPVINNKPVQTQQIINNQQKVSAPSFHNMNEAPVFTNTNVNVQTQSDIPVQNFSSVNNQFTQNVDFNSNTEINDENEPEIEDDSSDNELGFDIF